MNFKLIIICLALFTAVYTIDELRHMKEQRLEIEAAQGFKKITKENMKQRIATRRLQSNYRKLNIYFDMSSIESDLKSQGAADRIPFYKRVFAITGKWWGGALQVNDDRSKIAPTIKSMASRYERQLGFKFTYGTKMEDYDLLIRVFLCPNKGQALAYAGPFLRHPDTQRPISGTVCILPYGDANFKKAKDSINRAVGTVIHEFGHIIAFISLDRYHRDSLKVDNAIQRYKWTGPKVLKHARAYYNCPSLDGVPLQNNDGKLGGHWSEVFLANELMTPTTGSDPETVSPMTLALCEDTHWYKADYSFAENYNYLKNKGCDAFRKSCPSPAPCRNGTSGFITQDHKGVGYCRANSSGCAVEKKYSNRDCMQGAAWPASLTTYGASYGHNCVIAEGEFKKSSGGYIYTQRQVSVQANCSAGGGSYTLKFTNFQQNASGARTGDALVRCTKAGNVSFNTATRNSSTVKCYSPTEFCKQRFGSTTAACDESCRQNGRCQHVNPGARRLLECPPVNGGPTTSNKPVSKPTTPATTFTSARPSAGGAEYQCWCYSNGKRATACGDLPEDQDGVGY